MSETTPLKEGNTAPLSPNYPKILAIASFMTAIGFGMAYASLSLDDKNSDLFATKIESIRSMDLQWLYLALAVLGKTILIVNFVPTVYKKGLKGNVRSNPFFYEAKSSSDDNDKTEQPLIGYKEDGHLGMYNRSNRSVQHMVENSGGFFAAIGPVGWVFPKQTCLVVTAWSLARIVHQKGYASGYGKHALGFVVALLGIQTMEGLALIAFLKGQGYM